MSAVIKYREFSRLVDVLTMNELVSFSEYLDWHGELVLRVKSMVTGAHKDVCLVGDPFDVLEKIVEAKKLVRDHEYRSLRQGPAPKPQPQQAKDAGLIPTCPKCGGYGFITSYEDDYPEVCECRK